MGAVMAAASAASVSIRASGRRRSSTPRITAATTKSGRHPVGSSGGGVAEQDDHDDRQQGCPRLLSVSGVPPPPRANDSGAVEVDQDFALAHANDDGLVRFGAGIPLTVDHALGDAD